MSLNLPQPKPSVFISYTDRDRFGKKFAAALREVLIGEGYSDVYFFDHSAAESYGLLLWEDSGLPAEIVKREVLILVCTAAIIHSPPAKREFNIALKRDKFVVPIRYDSAQVPIALEAEFLDSFDELNYHNVFTLYARKLPGSYAIFRANLLASQRAIADLQVLAEQAQPQPKFGQIVPSGLA